MSDVTLKADTGLDAVTVSLVGPPGREQLAHIARTLEYAQGNEIMADTIVQELQKKYGTFDSNSGGTVREGFIIHSRDGQRLGESNSWYNQCKYQTNYSSVNLQSAPTVKCGSVVKYRIEPNRDKPELAFRFSVAVTDFGKASRLLTESVQAMQREKEAALERAQETAAKQKLEL